jgi:hypothetical protein
MGHVHDSVEQLLSAVAGGRGYDREPMAKNADSLSGSPFERVVVDGAPLVLKHLGCDLDWVARVTRERADRPPRVVTMWRDGVLDALPPVIDHAIVGAAYDPDSQRGAILMRDVAGTLVPTGTDRIGLAQHRRFLSHMAAVHAAFWGFRDRHGLAPQAAAYGAFHPAAARREVAAGHGDAVPPLVLAGWERLRAAAPTAYEVTLSLSGDPAPLVGALAETPATLVHRDWKYGNLGSHPDGRTVLLDWAFPGQGGPCTDLGWYLAVNCDRLPETKEETMTAFRSALRSRGVDTAGWWDRQMDLALVGAFVQLGWSKTHDPDELGWWTSRTEPVARDLLR